MTLVAQDSGGARWVPLRQPSDWATAHRAYLGAVACAGEAAQALTSRPSTRLSGDEVNLGCGVAGLAVLDRTVRETPLGADPLVPEGTLARVLVRALESTPGLTMSLFAGQVGMVLALAMIEPAATPAVVAAARSMARGLGGADHAVPAHFDVMLGVSGALPLGRWVTRSAGDRDLTSSVLSWLDATACPGSAWRTPAHTHRREPPRVAGRFYYDWGVAHGIPGTVAAAVHAELDLGDTAEAVGRWDRFGAAATQLLGLDEAHHDGSHPLLPAFSGPSGVEFGADAWCYGDAGACAALALAAFATGDSARRAAAGPLVAAAARSLRRAAAARWDELEPGICHGAAGLILLATRLYQATDDVRFAELAVDTADRALRLGLFDPPAVTARYGAGLLRGVAGVALVLHALLSARRPDWDIVLCLS